MAAAAALALAAFALAARRERPWWLVFGAARVGGSGASLRLLWRMREQLSGRFMVCAHYVVHVAWSVQC